MNYHEFLKSKSQDGNNYGFPACFVPEFLFDFQKHLVEWALLKGRAAIFADCGLGKTPIQLVWAENIVRKTRGNVLIVAPLAVSSQTTREGEKFGIQVKRSTDGKPHNGITITNYERLHYFSPDDFQGVVCDESSCLKNFDGIRKGIITEFLRTRPYRLLCTATAAPNDYIELGTTSEALGELGFMDMLGRFFKNDQNSLHPTSQRHEKGMLTQNKWRFKKHAELPFWRWVGSWARALRKPSDLGFDDGRFVLPDLIERQTLIKHAQLLPGELFPKIAHGLKEQRTERRQTLIQRCEMVAELVEKQERSLVWCHMNDEGNLLEKLIPDCAQISGSDSDEKKEELLLGFVSGKIPRLITKPKIAGFGMNFQHCNHVTFFPSHSYEQYYQGVRRCWRFGQKKPVVVDIVTTPGEIDVLSNLQRKSEAADRMYSELIQHMTDSLKIDKSVNFHQEEALPAWL